LKVEWHPDAYEDLASLAMVDQRRVRDAVAALAELDDARQRLIAYVGALKGHWKLRVGDLRLVCRLGGVENRSSWSCCWRIAA
jgi:mRNA-degrading endonuclease RelE of RelBE toxin-antitoxin system